MLKGKAAVVTGSTSGIGLGIAGALAAAGADLMINGFGEAAEIKKLREELAAAHGVRVAFSAADLSKPTDATGLIEDATRAIDLNGSLAAAWKQMADAGVKRIQASDIA